MISTPFQIEADYLPTDENVIVVSWQKSQMVNDTNNEKLKYSVYSSYVDNDGNE